MSKKNNLLVAASGTGGHIFPALAVSKEVEDEWNIHWLGIQQRLDANFIPPKYNLKTLNIKTPRKNIFLFYQYIKILMSTFQIIRILKEKKINLVFATGGYISAPTIVASKLLRIPIIIHESNVIPGMVTKYFGFLCNYVLLGFKETNSYLKNCKTIFTGTPLREQFYKFNFLPEWVPKGNGPLLIVMGGSQGAKAINQILYESQEFLTKKQFRIVHIVGETNQKNFHVASAKIVGKEQLVLKRLKRSCRVCENSKRALRHSLNKDPKTPKKPTVCLHCGREDAQIVLDHDWNTKQFRNWACRNCNAKFRESTFEEYVEAGKKWYHIT